MSLFRKPKKIQRRVFCADDDDDADPEPPPPPVISQGKKENKSAKKTALLSFADEEEETEVFKVKKSSQSKRLAKKREKEKKQVPDGDNNKFDNNDYERKDGKRLARELGDFVPVPSEAAPGSRLIRDDGSGDDEEEGRIHVRGLDLPSDKPKRGTAAAVSEEELDSEAEEWEEQQMQKAMPAIVDITGDGGIEVNPFSVAPPPPSLHDAPAHLRPLKTDAMQPPSTAHELVDALRKRLQELSTARNTTLSKKDELRERLLSAMRVRESRSARCSELDAAYRRAQAARGYLTDLIECLDEKMPQLETLEARALAVHRRRCDFLVERRRADVRDQAQDVLALAARAGSVKQADSEEKIRRAAEREGRRRARRLKRESAAAAAGSATVSHRDGDSSDDELPPHEHQHYRLERVFLLQLIMWNPLADEDNEDYEKMDWYKCLMMYGIRSEKPSSESSDSALEEEELNGEVTAVSERSVREDPDLCLVPTIINKVVLPKLTEIVEHAWDPMCVRACVRLRQLLIRFAALPDSDSALRHLAAAVRVRLSAALNADVFLPALPPNIMETSGGAFWRRCLGAGVRLLRAVLALTGPPPMLQADPLVLSLIETLSCGAGAAPATFMSHACVALAETLPRSGSLRAKALNRLAVLAKLALSRLQSDNPLHLKALEQARSVISEARAMDRE
ncbi:hypothetical protein K1T71_003532 [Dendrolimus kikuchii]|uniref:Uncharacterized protein n=1 Tax=Dendrolimus kikuchii TaxID=765133 RepID=A0ACC1DDE0_9NEOP|nr:hypothetical protein K1T71_003532 [Dendrolimus kikuchii]